jgi:hypothetical protein
MVTIEELLCAVDKVVLEDAMWKVAYSIPYDPKFDEFEVALESLATLAGLDRLWVYDQCRKILDEKEEMSCQKLKQLGVGESLLKRLKSANASDEIASLDSPTGG